MAAEMNDMKTFYEGQIHSLEEENRRLLDTLIRHSKDRANGALQRPTTSPLCQPEMYQTNYSQQPLADAFSAASSQAFANNTSSLNRPLSGNTLGKSKQLANACYNQTSNSTSMFSVGSQQKIIPLKQLKDVICDIYAQKIKYDIKCRESNLPIETMEQFMYTYLNQKYGLKSLIIEWASTLINGVKTYLREDHEITLFGKILKNECDEEFRFIQMHVKDTLNNLLKILLREKYH